jgi:2-methylisocitrate lyase-like PEP mutase family enzyme
MRDNAEMIASLDPSMPVIADADTGYGGPIMVSRTVAQYARSGVAAMHIEDQVSKTATDLSLTLQLTCLRLNKSGADIY